MTGPWHSHYGITVGVHTDLVEAKVYVLTKAPTYPHPRKQQPPPNSDSKRTRKRAKHKQEQPQQQLPKPTTTKGPQIRAPPPREPQLATNTLDDPLAPKNEEEPLNNKQAEENQQTHNHGATNVWTAEANSALWRWAKDQADHNNTKNWSKPTEMVTRSWAYQLAPSEACDNGHAYGAWV